MVAMRLARQGTNKRAFFRIVVAEKSFPRNGRTIENVGTYDPLKTDAQVVLKMDRVKFWLEKGAQPTLGVKNLLRKYLK
ncbi:MAG: 30S ribosomal protein S16 [Deltaproteobacteria bacterium GWA2_38_16]|nr:MAG: 30S ribosomal protein S16 [Deltaproteobacteria bacterium GWA2_38_16]OGQ03122.1 MAG: 30S ribosomal protein S16 [Deltaproteobacteria bacterium RIFCSPHIGHO2_02_FULL_38_15]OGQ30005.1 MAG: 30S ribosomal protein S16 [Deltaproteobacteria bacterium RIFCSPLOWO2_01_FULL_38_9]OGQ60201.1 MAG: 30S ribosomal protein S16 [Deltaproteobacteria bacterium RIFCSPLOWO2_12_FULL_38_8]HBQ20458.1 30S ribosomal protein S16 [Deltaproteobacteria bacterium]